MLNKVFIMGRLTSDPELRRTQSGTAVAGFSLAVDRNFKGQDGEKGTDFINCTAWRNTAEFVSKYFGKGRMAVVEGRLEVQNYKDKNGENRTSTRVVVDNIYFGDSKRGDSGNESNNGSNAYAPAYAPAPADQPAAESQSQFTELAEDDDLPF